MIDKEKDGPMAAAFWTIGFTGHRNLRGLDEQLRAQVAEELARLEEMAAPGGLVFLGAVAAGADLLIIREIAARGWSWKLCLPRSVEAHREETLRTGGRELAPLIDNAIYVEQITGCEQEEAAFYEADIDIVDDCDLLLVIWDGLPDGPAGGGTADVVTYARAVGKPLVWVHADGRGVTRECLPEAAQGFWTAPLLDLQPLLVQVDLRELGALPAAQKLVGLADALALAHLPQIRRLETWFTLSNLAATLLSGFSVQFQVNHALFQAMLGAGVLLNLLSLLGRRLAKQQRQGIGVNARELCELGRALCMTARAQSQIRLRLDELGFQAYKPVATALEVRDMQEPAPLGLEKFKEMYLRDRIEHQKDYYHRCFQRARRNFRTLALAGTTLALLGATAGIARMILKTLGYLLPAPAGFTLEFLNTVAPALAVAVSALVVIHEFRRRASIYGDLEEEDLRKYAVRLQAANAWPRVREIVSQVEFALLNEVHSWAQMNRPAGKPEKTRGRG